jgi:hypothetical protein
MAPNSSNIAVPSVMLTANANWLSRRHRADDDADCRRDATRTVLRRQRR